MLWLRKTRLLGVAGFGAFAFTAIAADTQVRQAISTPSAADAVISAAASSTAFATDLYQVLLKENAGKNIFFSPYSITTILGLTTSGARGQTATEMKQVLHVTDLDAMNAGIAKVSTQLGDTRNGTRPYQLHVANALWGDQRYHVVPAFQQLAQKSYGTDGVRALDFRKSPEPSRITINKWVEDQTQARIKDLLPADSIDDSTAMVLTNAIYFKGAWETKFTAGFTKMQPFHAADGKSISVLLMDRGGALPYFENDEIQVVSLPYEAASASPRQVVSMLVILPRRTDGLADLEKRITPENLNQWIDGLQRKTVRVYLPRFSITSPTRLSPLLKGMGMPTAFDDKRADFRGLVTIAEGDNMYIGDVFHKAFIDVDENGTEAAAATAVTEVMVTGARAPQDPFTFRADHPFFFVIRHEPTNSILFMGRLVSPGAN